MKRQLPTCSPSTLIEWLPIQPTQGRRIKSISTGGARSARLTALNLFIRRPCVGCVGKGSRTRAIESALSKGKTSNVRSFHTASNVIKYEVLIAASSRASAEVAWLWADISGAELLVAHIMRRDRRMNFSDRSQARGALARLKAERTVIAALREWLGDAATGEAA